MVKFDTVCAAALSAFSENDKLDLKVSRSFGKGLKEEKLLSRSAGAVSVPSG